MNFDSVFKEGFTFDDVLLVPRYSSVLPSEVSTLTHFSKNIKLSIPIVSAAMDTISESQMAISLAREGGISVIHKNMSIDDQVTQVNSVKRSESGIILNPITLPNTATALEAKAVMRDNNIGGIPILNSSKKLVGIVTSRDLRFEKKLNQSVSQIMTSKKLITTNKSTSLKEAETILQDNRIEKLPIVDASNNLVGLITYRDIIKVKEQPTACKDSLGRFRKPFDGLEDILVKDKSLLFNTDLVESLEFDNLIRQAMTTMDSAYHRKESRGAHAREDFAKRDDKNFMKHTLAWQKDKKVEIKYRDVHATTLTNDVQYFPPKERVY